MTSKYGIKNLNAVVGRSIIDKDKLYIIKCLCQKTLNAPFNVRFHIPYRHYDPNLGFMLHMTTFLF